MSADIDGTGSLATNATIICFSHLRWNFVFQRPQHLLSRAARSYSVWYFEEPVFEACTHSRLDIRIDDASGVRVTVPILPEGTGKNEATAILRKLLAGLLQDLASAPLIAWYYTPIALTFSEPSNFDVCVYDNMDELSAFAGAPPELTGLEKELFSRADVVFTGGNSLYEAKRDLHSNIHAFPSSVDVAHFVQARTAGPNEPEDQRGIGRPRLGFFGVIDERMDLKLLEEVARLKPGWHFIMIGPVAKIDAGTLPRLPNIHWLGGKAYKELPRYLAGWDIGLMPFAMNESTRFISPTKTPEFLAAGVPVISTPLSDVIRPYGAQQLVEIAQDASSFASKAEALLELPREEWLSRVDQQLAKNSWNLTWERMDALIRKAGVVGRRPQTQPEQFGEAHV
jgi:glycosyltransferase involved in cell wall biosynthesis